MNGALPDLVVPEYLATSFPQWLAHMDRIEENREVAILLDAECLAPVPPPQRQTALARLGEIATRDEVQRFVHTIGGRGSVKPPEWVLFARGTFMGIAHTRLDALTRMAKIRNDLETLHYYANLKIEHARRRPQPSSARDAIAGMIEANRRLAPVDVLIGEVCYVEGSGFYILRHPRLVNSARPLHAVEPEEAIRLLMDAWWAEVVQMGPWTVSLPAVTRAIASLRSLLEESSPPEIPALEAAIVDSVVDVSHYDVDRE